MIINITSLEALCLELKMLGTFMSAIAYGIVIVLSGNCILLLHKKRGIYSNRMQLFLLTYVAVMLLLSTLAITQSIWGLTLLTFHRHDSLFNLPLYALVENTISPLPLTIWGADGFMIWRCVILYQGVGRGPRIFITVMLSVLSTVSFGCGVMLFLGFYYRLRLMTKFALWLTGMSTFVNIMLVLLIILRLVHHQRRMRKILGGENGSPYSQIITMCIESSALIVVFSVAYIVLGFWWANGPAIIPLLLLPHICVISPLLIVYRVAKGRAIHTTVRPLSEGETAQIRFNNPPSTFSSQRAGV